MSGSQVVIQIIEGMKKVGGGQTSTVVPCSKPAQMFYASLSV